LARLLAVYLSSNKAVNKRLYAVYNIRRRSLSIVVCQCINMGLRQWMKMWKSTQILK